MKPSEYAIPGDWVKRAACRGATESMTDEHRDSRKLCETCPVLDECRSWALTYPDPADGMIAGGYTTRQRSRVRRGLPPGRGVPGRAPKAAQDTPALLRFNEQAPFAALVVAIDSLDYASLRGRRRAS